MEDNKQPDQIFRENIESAEMAPPDQVWNNLERQLDAVHAARSRRRLVPLLALLFVAVSTGLYFFLPEKQPASVIPEGAFTQAGQRAAHRAEAGPVNPVADAAGVQHPVSGPEPGVAARITPPARRPVRGMSSVSPAGSHGERAAGQPNASRQRPGARPSAGSAPGMSLAENHSAAPAAGTVVLAPAVSSGGNVPASGPSGVKAETNGLAAANHTEETVDHDPGRVAASSEAAVAQPASADVTEVPAAEIPATSGPEAAADTSTDYRSEEKKTGWLHRFSKTLSLELFYGADYPDRRLQSNPSYAGVGATENPATYNAQESPLYSYSTGLRFRSDLSSRWSVSTGVFYSTYNRSCDLGDAYVVSDSVFEQAVCPGQTQGNHPPQHHNSQGYYGQPSPGLHYVVHTSNGVVDLTNIPMHDGKHHGPGGPPDCPRDGDTLLFAGTARMEISYVNIPVTVRYLLRPGKLSWYTEAGAAVSFVNSNSVEVSLSGTETESNEVINIERTSYSLLFSAGAALSLGRGWSASIEPALRYFITPVNESSSMRAYPYFIGLRAAVGLHF